MSRKYQRLLQVSIQVVRQDVLRGHLRWKVTDLSRVSRISRTAIYLRLGRNKSQILKTALTVLLGDLYGHSPERVEISQNQTELEGLFRSRYLVMQSPELLSFYFLHRNRGDEFGEIIRQNEERFLALVSQRNGIKNRDFLLLIRTLIHGISVAPFLNDQEVAICMRQLQALVRRGGT